MVRKIPPRRINNGDDLGVVIFGVDSKIAVEWIFGLTAVKRDT